MKKAIIIVVVLLLLAVACYLLLKNNQAKAPTEETKQTEQQPQYTHTPEQPVEVSGQTQTKNNAGNPDYTPSTSPTGGETPGSDIQVVEVDYDGTSFNP